MVGLICAAAVVTSCASAPSRSGLVDKLQERNGITAEQAGCIADGLYDGMPDEQPAIRRLTPAELRTVAKPENAGKVPADVIQILRDVTTACVPTGTTTPINP